MPAFILNKQTKPSKPSSELVATARRWTLNLRITSEGYGFPKGTKPTQSSTYLGFETGHRAHCDAQRINQSLCSEPNRIPEARMGWKGNLQSQEVQFKATPFFSLSLLLLSTRMKQQGPKCEKDSLISKSIQSMCQALSYYKAQFLLSNILKLGNRVRHINNHKTKGYML